MGVCRGWENGNPYVWRFRPSITVSVSQQLICGSASSALVLIHPALMQGKPKSKFSQCLTDLGLGRPVSTQQFSKRRAGGLPSAVSRQPSFCFLTSLSFFSLALPPLPTDWNECAHSSEHDCHPTARCINLEGSYACQCLTTRDTNPSRAGRVCEGACPRQCSEGCFARHSTKGYSSVSVLFLFSFPKKLM